MTMPPRDVGLDVVRAWKRHRADYQRTLRARLVAERVCINGRSHGPATHGILCIHCRAVHRGVAVDVIQAEDVRRAELALAERLAQLHERPVTDEDIDIIAEVHAEASAGAK